MLRALAVFATAFLGSCAQIATAPPTATPPPPVVVLPSTPRDGGVPRDGAARNASEIPPRRELYAEAPAAADGVKPYTTVRLFFGTDRNLTGSTKPAEVFGENRGEALIFGTCDVSIPRGHQPGELESPVILRRFLESPERHVMLLSVTTKSRDEMFAQMADILAGGAAHRAFVFVHGFNNSFEDAARRTAQIYYDVGFDGVPLFYSWPSKGKASDYSYDQNNADQAVAYMKVFLSDLAASGEFDSITLVAHSMGSRALTRALTELISELPRDQVAKFSELILAAPDIDADVFRNDIAPALAAVGKPVTVYASAKDLAMVASKDFGGYPRLGDARNGIVIVRGVESIDATGVDTNLFWGIGHSYVADSPQMLHDLHDLVVARLRAAQRGDLEEVPTERGAYWRFK